MGSLFQEPAASGVRGLPPIVVALVPLVARGVRTAGGRRHAAGARVPTAGRAPTQRAEPCGHQAQPGPQPLRKRRFAPGRTPAALLHISYPTPGRCVVIALDKAGKPYWDRFWEKHDVPKTIGPREPGFRDYVFQRFRSYFHEVFSKMETQNVRLLEIGCAGSLWLP